MLKLAHHKHSFKPLPHHHTSFRGLFLILLVLGMALFSMQSVAHASFMDLTAKISGPLPTVPAVITAPNDGVTFHRSDIVVHGTCEHLTPASVVVIYIDDEIAGSTACGTDDTFYLPITLLPGTHALLARTSNTTDDFGPDSDIIHVTYAPPAIVPATTGSPGSTSTTGSTSRRTSGGSCTTASQTLRVNQSPTYLDYGKFAAANFEFSLAGGCAPYRTVIDWGDGVVDTLTVKDNELQSIKHGYADLKPKYTVTLTATSADGQKASFSTVAVTSYIPNIYNGGLVKVDVPFILTFQGTLVRAFIVYLAILTLFGVAWYDKHVRRVRVGGVHIFPPHPDSTN